MKKIAGTLLAVCMLLAGCGKSGDVGSIGVPSEVQTSSALQERDGASAPEQEMGNHSTSENGMVEEIGPVGIDDIPDISTWNEYTCTLEDTEFTFKLPPFFIFEVDGDRGEIFCDNESPFYKYFPGRDTLVGVIALDNNGYTQISDTEYEVPEVGQSFTYILSTSLEPQTFFEVGEYVVFVSGVGYFLPSIIHHIEKGYSLLFFSEGEPEMPVELFLQIASTIET